MDCLCVRWSNEEITIELRSKKPLTASSISKFSALSREAEKLTEDPGTLITTEEKER
jgi:hypothetical protein